MKQVQTRTREVLEVTHPDGRIEYLTEENYLGFGEWKHDLIVESTRNDSGEPVLTGRSGAIYRLKKLSFDYPLTGGRLPNTLATTAENNSTTEEKQMSTQVAPMPISSKSPVFLAAQESETLDIIENLLLNVPHDTSLTDDLILTIQAHIASEGKDGNKSHDELGQLARKAKMWGVFKLCGQVKGSEEFQSLIAKHTPEIEVVGGNQMGQVISVGTTAKEVASPIKEDWLSQLPVVTDTPQDLLKAHGLTKTGKPEKNAKYDFVTALHKEFSRSGASQFLNDQKLHHLFDNYLLSLTLDHLNTSECKSKVDAAIKVIQAIHPKLTQKLFWGKVKEVGSTLGYNAAKTTKEKPAKSGKGKRSLPTILMTRPDGTTEILDSVTFTGYENKSALIKGNSGKYVDPNGKTWEFSTVETPQTSTKSKVAKTPKGSCASARKVKEVKLLPVPTIESISHLENLDRKDLQYTVKALKSHDVPINVKGNYASDVIKIALAKHYLGIENYVPAPKTEKVKGSKTPENPLPMPEAITWQEVLEMSYKQLQQFCKVLRSNGLFEGNVGGAGSGKVILLEKAASAMRQLGHDIIEANFNPQNPDTATPTLERNGMKYDLMCQATALLAA